jgi:hypothetical protein
MKPEFISILEPSRSKASFLPWPRNHWEIISGMMKYQT